MRPRFRLTALVACVAFLAWAAAAQFSAGTAAPTDAQATQQSISAQELQAFIKERASFVLLDVRSQEEFGKGHIRGAILEPVEDITDGYVDFPKDVMIVVYCNTGTRSERAAAYMRSHGYKRVYVLAGGYAAWTAAL